MRLKRALVGIILSFSASGFIATGVNEGAYGDVFAEHGQQQGQMNALLSSEFISSDDQQLLSAGLKQMIESKQHDTRREIRQTMDDQKQLIEDVTLNNQVNEQKVAQDEVGSLKEQLKQLEEQSEQPYIVKEDEAQVANLVSQLDSVSSSPTVAPIRVLASEVATFSSEMTQHQKEMHATVDDLKAFNEETRTIMKSKYLLASDKKALEQDSKENQKYFKDADDLASLATRKSESQELIRMIQVKVDETTDEFASFEKDARELVKSSENLLSKGDLTKEEQKELQQHIGLVNNALNLKEYSPGDLESAMGDLDASYDDLHEKSEERIAEAKKKAAEEKAKREAEEEKRKAEEEKRQREAQAAAEEARQQEVQQQQAQASSATPTLVGEWYQAPAGYKFLKVESGKTYGQVKNPGNFSLITTAEASNYSPGHGNGSAKQ